MRTLSVESLQVAWRGQTCVQDLSFQVQSGSPTAHREAETAKAHRG